MTVPVAAPLDTVTVAGGAKLGDGLVLTIVSADPLTLAVTLELLEDAV